MLLTPTDCGKTAHPQITQIEIQTDWEEVDTRGDGRHAADDLNPFLPKPTVAPFGINPTAVMTS
jgi:hypothetical protein